jgi:hypothetical protein
MQVRVSRMIVVACIDRCLHAGCVGGVVCCRCVVFVLLIDWVECRAFIGVLIAAS